MKPTIRYFDDYGLASVEFEGIKVNTLLNQPGEKRSCEKAFLGARYSRSLGSLLSLCEEFRKSKKDAGEKLDNIFHGYGHASVGDMADIMISLEGIPLFTALKIFNIVPTYSGQESSTRYISFEDTGFEFSNNIDKKIQQDWFNLYKKYEPIFKEYLISEYNPKKEKSISCALYDSLRYFLPLGAKTNVALCTSARNMAQLISELRASANKVENKLSAIIRALLTDLEKDKIEQEELACLNEVPEKLKELGYVPEAKELIRHSEPDYTQAKIIKEVFELIKSNGHKSRRSYHEVKSEARYWATPFLELLNLNNADILGKEINAIVNKHCKNYFNNLGNLFQEGYINLQGYMDIGALRDMNRHRSSERFIPLLYDQYEVDLDNPVLFLPPIIYARDIKEEITADIKKIFDYMRSNKDSISKEYLKYCLPLMSGAYYNFGFSKADLFYIGKLRTKLGGHISYRRITNSWLEYIKDNLGIDIEIKDIPSTKKLTPEEIYKRG